MFKYVHHIEYIVQDCDAMVAYLAKNFHMTPDHVEVNKKGREAHFNLGATQIQFLEPDPTSAKGRRLAEHGPGVGHVAWGVDDIGQAAIELSAKGVKLRQENANTTDARVVHRPTTVSHKYRAINTDPSYSHGVMFQLIGVDD